ncbi:unnamed protein product, partial [marine sediment metagenome]
PHNQDLYTSEKPRLLYSYAKFPIKFSAFGGNYK